MRLPPGLYDLIVSEATSKAIDTLQPEAVAVENLRSDSAADRLIDAVREQLARVVQDLDAGTDEAHVLQQLHLINELLRHVRGSELADADSVDLLSQPPRVLRGIRSPGLQAPDHPQTGLVTPWLFTAGRGSPALVTELRREAAACDSIDILVSFIRIAGVRKLIDVLRNVTAADASGRARTRIRVLTTTYMGATELEALNELAGLNGCDVRVSLDGRRTRLHAKAWIFHRTTGFGSAYVGSANLSGAALMGGLEWTVKFTERGQPALYARAKAHFDTLWEDGEFTPYRPDDEASRAAVAEALRRERRERGEEVDIAPPVFFDIEPKPYQRDMLEQLARARELGRNRNLVVAATGTGKTVVAALDYRNMAAELGHLPSLLFVAHRAQILRQALRTYREVLRDNSFGEILVGGTQPSSHTHLFASIDSITSRQLVDGLGTDHWHTVVIDECHRIAADRFDRFATAIQPAQLLGLTATPERSDGKPIGGYFTPRPDGSPAVELRLWDALDMQLLTPFEYYGCDDDTDFSDVPWDKPGETRALELAVAANQARARLVINEWRRLTGNPLKSKSLIFCVSVAHARFMTEQINAAGVPAMCVVGETPKAEQIRAPRRLANGDVCALVTVDLYNEGVDIPAVDTLLLLRPTQSPLLFQQQIGRGLRLAPGKESCLVLDFVGQHRADFRFDRLLSGITGLTRTQLIDGVENGFSGLPPGCHIHLQQQTRDQVLRGLRALVQQSWRRLTGELQAYSALRGTRTVSLPEFLRDQRIDLGEVYRDAKPSGWTSLRRSAGLVEGEGTEEEADLSRRLGWLQHVDDPQQIELLGRVAEAPARYEARSTEEAVRLQMLAYQTQSGRDALPYAEFLSALDQHYTCKEELSQLAAVLAARTDLKPSPVPNLNAPLVLHGSYELREILAAVGYYTADRRPLFRAGVLPMDDRRVELLFVTLDKTTGYHSGIAYRDYAVSPSRFHWQTQNAAGPDTPAGRRYVESPGNAWTFQLFVRARKGEAYRACGPVFIAEPSDVSGDRPMNIEWTLGVPLSARLFGEFSVLRGQ
jgi:superfamily II DNA or RNA helicase/HKD family nuclease